MTGYFLSPRAQTDLDEIWDYTATQWSSKQAELYLRQLQSSIEAVAVDPRLGRPCDHIRVGYRRYPAGSHVLFYRIVDIGVDVVRILHSRMDFERHL